VIAREGGNTYHIRLPKQASKAEIIQAIWRATGRDLRAIWIDGMMTDFPIPIEENLVIDIETAARRKIEHVPGRPRAKRSQ
jgi:hypothetical protein